MKSKILILILLAGLSLPAYAEKKYPSVQAEVNAIYAAYEKRNNSFLGKWQCASLMGCWKMKIPKNTSQEARAIIKKREGQAAIAYLEYINSACDEHNGYKNCTKEELKRIAEEQQEEIKRQKRDKDFADLFLYMGNGPGPRLGGD